MFKILGIILIVFSTSFLGYLKANSYKNRIYELNEFKKGVELFETEIKFLKSPLSEAFLKIGQNLSGNISDLFVEFSKRYNLNESDNVTAIWDNIIDKNSAYFSLAKSDVSLLKEFGIMLGATDIDGQIENISSIVSRLKYNIKDAADLQQKNAKLYQNFGIYSGVLIAILLI